MAGVLAPVEVIALEVARADLHYVSMAVVGAQSDLAAAEIALVQYGAMAAYESQLHFDRTLGWKLEASWPPGTAKAARMSGKFFADTKRNLDGVVSHFNALLEANHGAFFPRNRLRWVDFLRDDLSVVTVNGRPYTSLISAHYLMGLDPAQTASFDQVNDAIQRLATGMGNIAGALLWDSGIPAHPPAPKPVVEFWNAKSTTALPRLFGGTLAPSLAASLLTVQCIAATADRSAARAMCPWCETAARKHRFVALFQSLTALTILRDASPDSVGHEMRALLAEPESKWLLDQGRLRNGLVHLGMQDVATHIRTGDTVDDAVAAYTGVAADEVAARVSDHLSRFTEVLTSWMLTPTADGDSFMKALHKAPTG